MSEKGTELDIEVRCVNVTEVPLTAFPRQRGPSGLLQI